MSQLSTRTYQTVALCEEIRIPESAGNSVSLVESEIIGFKIQEYKYRLKRNLESHLRLE